MPVWRLFLALVLTFALPLQGFAAASMLARSSQSTPATAHRAVHAAGMTGASVLEADAAKSKVQPGETDRSASHAKPCCQPMLLAAAVIDQVGALRPDEQPPFAAAQLVSWSEPVPRKPPKA